MKHNMIAGQEIRRRRRNREEIATLVGEYRACGLSLAAFARLKGVCLVTVTRWLRLAAGEGRTQETLGHRLVPVRVTEAVHPRWGAAPAFELTLSGGQRLSIPPDFEEADLRRLIAVLKETC
jgi:hypothetical protein